MSIPLIRINGFDFDSTQPVQAHEVKELGTFLPWLIDYMAAFVVIGIGAVGIKWFAIGGGTHYLISKFLQFAPALFNMATTGM